MRGRNQLPKPVLILLFLLLPRDASATAKPQYVVLVPSQLYTGVTEKACVILNHMNETVTLTVTLECEMVTKTLFSDRVTQRDSFYCSSFTIPELPSSSAFITVQVKGPTQDFIKRKIMHVIKAESLIFLQTDKPIYKPGQTVRIRIVSVDMNFHPLDEMFPVVYVENPKKNRIFQQQSLKLQGGLSQLSFPLSVEPILGHYKVILHKEPGKKIAQSFEVNEYVLPKFEVQVKMPKTIGFLEEEFMVSACGLYTYGKPVPGLVTINICRKYSQYRSLCHDKHSQSICEEFSQQADSKGCFTKLVKTKIFQLRQKGHDMTIQVEAKVKEEGTGLELTGHGSCEITNILSKLKFTKVDSYYRRGLPFFGQVLLVDEKDQPIPNKNILVAVDAVYISSFTTNKHGLANIFIDTTNLTSYFITVTVTYKQNQQCFDNWWLGEFHTQAHHTAYHVFSPSKSYIHLVPAVGTLTCGQTQEIQVQYMLNGQILKDEKELTFYYLIKARGSISKSGIHVLSIKRGPVKGTFSFSFQVESDIAPTAHLFVYTVLPDGEIVADTDKLEIENCFANKVNLSFSPARGLPASDARLAVTATPVSLCALRAVDQSVLLMKPEAELSPQSVYHSLPPEDSLLYDRFGHPESTDFEECINAGDITHNGIIYTPKQALGDEDVHGIFQSAGLSIFTNSKIRKPHFCQPPHSYAPMAYVTASQGVLLGSPGVHGVTAAAGVAYNPREEVQTLQVKETVRKYFPETWIWDLVVLNSTGGSELAVKVPDTITEWKASALCLSGTTGLGLSPIISFQAFQPFFLELTLPYSVVRGETFTLKATVFNYLSYCIQVSVQLVVSSAFLAVPAEMNEESHCVCENRQKTVSWVVTPKSLGKVNFTATVEVLPSQKLCSNEAPKVQIPELKDTVVKPLIVEPEGIEKEETFNTLLCASDTGAPEKLSLKVPSNVVEGSARATYSVLGDILGSAMQNLQNLLRMPYGCGEQNMVLFVPNIYVLNYLNETRQLTEKIKSKAVSHLISGYQRQLNYKHSDGSYSTFGDHDGKSHGNTWLTAFVLKSFAQAQSYIFVESSHIMNAFTWLSRKQKENGCFQRSGSLLNNAIKGGVDDEVTLSAYVTIALLEMPLPVTHSVVRNALFCLEMAWSSISEAQGSLTYTKALLAYAFALAGNQAKRSELLESLVRDAVKEEDSMHWEHPRKLQEAGTVFHQPRAPSVEVEMASYALLALLTVQPSPSSEDLSAASRIVKWVTKQQNPHGGFSSTQDTVVALQALAKYGAATFTKNENATLVTIKSSETFSEEFQLDDTNRLLLQEVGLPEVPGEYNTTVSGSGCVYLQTSLKYNILPKKERKAPFALQVDTLPKNCDGVDAHRKFQIHISISYTGERPSSNMVIVDVKMVSGFIPMKPSVKKLQQQPQIQRTEMSINHVLIYFEELTSRTLSFSFLVEQDIQVKNLKPATVKAYDYYETDEFTIEEYSAPCSAESEQGNA
ncbi:PREDICTED: alpha-2-macroglobulin-like [Galeopterus variegatus]|uniref:Alpha-2-macroglobulin-like n=1 Tax=Galeopterus variegatus TaxID=482537 RepID=A0ABM0RRP4_GALVR|nr:PREDICTED: alpha-2-macroglobulin-like [Galeopterus variegatus]